MSLGKIIYDGRVPVKDTGSFLGFLDNARVTIEASYKGLITLDDKHVVNRHEFSIKNGVLRDKKNNPYVEIVAPKDNPGLNPSGWYWVVNIEANGMTWENNISFSPGETICITTTDEHVIDNSNVVFVPGAKGEPGEKGEPGTSFNYDDLTDEQKKEIKGEKGDKLIFNDLTAKDKAELKGEKGENLKFEDLTPSQKEEIKGKQGIQGLTGKAATIKVGEVKTGDIAKVVNSGNENNAVFNFDLPKGAQGIQGKQGLPGKDLKFTDLTDEQKLALKGSKGEPGKPLTFADLTAEQKLALKGEKGADGTMSFEDLTDEQKAGLKGEPGKNGKFADLTQAEKDSIKGVKGDPGKDADLNINPVSIGKGAVANKNNGVAIGLGTKAPGKLSTAVGGNAGAEGDFTVSVGFNSKATGLHSIAIGADSKATQDDTVSFGNDSRKRRIVNVAEPVDDTDVATKKYVDDNVGGNNEPIFIPGDIGKSLGMIVYLSGGIVTIDNLYGGRVSNLKDYKKLEYTDNNKMIDYNNVEYKYGIIIELPERFKPNLKYYRKNNNSVWYLLSSFEIVSTYNYGTASVLYNPNLNKFCIATEKQSSTTDLRVYGKAIWVSAGVK